METDRKVDPEFDISTGASLSFKDGRMTFTARTVHLEVGGTVTLWTDETIAERSYREPDPLELAELFTLLAETCSRRAREASRARRSEAETESRKMIEAVSTQLAELRAGSTAPASDFLTLAPESVNPDDCGRCAGCGKIANTEEGEPWKYWLEIPVGSSAAVVSGIVRPIPCPKCGGSGKSSIRFGIPPDAPATEGGA